MGSLFLLEGLPRISWVILIGLVSFALSKKTTTLDQTIEGMVFIDGNASIAETNKNFVCATLDWWPPTKCDYGNCSWGNTSLINLDLNNIVLINAIKAFDGFMLRLGGSLQDKLIYETEDHKPQKCGDFVKTNNSDLFNFNDGCLKLRRWNELNKFFKETGASVVFGLNALYGKIRQGNRSVGNWNQSNAASFIRYTAAKKFPVVGWELGNELGGYAVGISVEPDQYATDAKVLRNLLDSIYKYSKIKSMLLAPGSFFETKWFGKFISKTTKILDVASHHIYNLGSGADSRLVVKIQNATYLDNVVYAFATLRDMLNTSKSRAVSWVSEAGGAYNSGGKGVSDTFISSFWYLDQLGLASLYNTKTYCRQSLVGGNYGLLDANLSRPNPDYYSALLWHQLMGTKVLSASFAESDNLRVYSLCAKQSGVVLLFINLEPNSTIKANIDCQSLGQCNIREEYHLTPEGGNIQSRTMLLNGRDLKLTKSKRIPPFEPLRVKSSGPMTIAHSSIAFVHLTKASPIACLRDFN